MRVVPWVLADENTQNDYVYLHWFQDVKTDAVANYARLVCRAPKRQQQTGK